MAVAIMPVQARQQQRSVPGHQSGQAQEDDARRPSQMRKGKWQRCIRCRRRKFRQKARRCFSDGPDNTGQAVPGRGCLPAVPDVQRRKVAVHMLQAHTGVGRLTSIARYDTRQR